MCLEVIILNRLSELGIVEKKEVKAIDNFIDNFIISPGDKVYIRGDIEFGYIQEMRSDFSVETGIISEEILINIDFRKLDNNLCGEMIFSNKGYPIGILEEYDY